MIKVKPIICASGLARRQALYKPIENLGILIDSAKLDLARIKVNEEIDRHLAIASKQWGKRLYVDSQNSCYAKVKKAISEGLYNKTFGQGIIDYQKDKEFNIRSPSVFLDFLKDVGYKVPKITKKDEDGEYSQEESTSELALRKLIADNQFKYPQGDAALIAVLNARELLTLKSRYLNARFFPKPEGVVFLSAYNAGSGTLTGRRSSKKHFLGYGGNGQNIPKHSDSARLFRECLVSRPGKILLSVDQISAEDWPVSALASNVSALDELKSGTDRHSKLASFIFNIPIESRTTDEWKKSIERYLGKKTRHANNYGMQALRMHDSLMQEGRFFPVEICKMLLERANAADPSIKNVFHKYVEGEINSTRILRTPFSRERQFLGFRPNAKNTNLLNEAYSYIPQSIVGDNTGFALEELQLNPESGIYVLQEGHDSIIQEVNFEPSNYNNSVVLLSIALERTIEAFQRPITFHNGITIDIPVEAELSWNFSESVKIKTLDKAGIEAALSELGERPV
jgi:hypothetical protein